MGNKTIESPKFKKTVEDVLDALATLYSVSQRVFMLEFSNIPKSVLHEMVRLRFTKKYNGTPLEDIADYATEVIYYYESYYKANLSKKHKKKNAGPPFTLRNADDLASFHKFLCLMVELHKLSPKHFVKLFPKCPSYYWDKIDDLREASYTYKYGSDTYVDCLRKSKYVSMAYSKIKDSSKLKAEEC